MFGREILLEQLQHAQAMVDLYRGLLESCDRLSPVYAEAQRGSSLTGPQLGELAFLLCGKSRDRAVTFFSRKYGIRKSDVQREAARLRDLAERAISAEEGEIRGSAAASSLLERPASVGGHAECVESVGGAKPAKRAGGRATLDGVGDFPKEVEDMILKLLPTADTTGMIWSASSPPSSPASSPCSIEEGAGDAKAELRDQKCGDKMAAGETPGKTPVDERMGPQHHKHRARRAGDPREPSKAGHNKTRNGTDKSGNPNTPAQPVEPSQRPGSLESQHVDYGVVRLADANSRPREEYGDSDSEAGPRRR